MFCIWYEQQNTSHRDFFDELMTVWMDSEFEEALRDLKSAH